ncbi:MAG: hypothetical protein ACKPE6_07940 [Gammaproteobacteria bacterium]
MKPEQSKDVLRHQIEDQVRDYLERGGAVKAVEQGATGRDPAQPPSATFRSFTPRPREERTYVPEVVAAIEARRRKPKATRAKTEGKPRMEKRAVLDDFGEPIRWEWVEVGDT